MSLPLGTIAGAILGIALLMPAVSRALEIESAIDEIITPFLEDKPYLGLVVGVTQPTGRQILGYGHVAFADKSQIPDGKTIFEIGSITKVFTGTLLADQVLAGTVQLDDPVQKHLPEALTVPRRDGRDITLLHLATHTSGLPVQPPLIGLFALITKDPANPYAEYGPEQLKETLAQVQLPRPIGSQFDYSNLGAGLLGHALTHAAGTENYEALLIRQILEPLDLADTRIVLSNEQENRFARGHDRNGNETSVWTFGCLEACGGLRSTVADLLDFTDANLGRRETTLTEAFEMAQQGWRETGRKGQFVGLCWMRQKIPETSQTMIWHNGGTGGYRSFMAFLPESGVGVVILSNSPHRLDPLGVSILKILDDAEKK